VTSLLATEWIKLRHRWMPRILIFIMLAIVGVLSLASLGLHNLRADLVLPQGLLAGLALAGILSPFLWPILAGAWPGNEFSWGTIRMVLSRRPNRVEQSLAGLAMMMLYVIAALLIAVIFSGVVGLLLSIGFTHQGFDEAVARPGFAFGLIKTFLAEVYAVGLYVVIAYAAGTIFRSPAAGIGIGIGSWIAQQVVRGIFVGLLSGTWGEVADRFPDAYITALPVRTMSSAVRGRFLDTQNFSGPGIVESIVGIAIYMVILMGLALFITSRRDVTD
jgi:ABC-type transport system involved in multi-copper enzyme maturation permease subunit